MRKRIYLSPPHMSGNEQKYINEAFESNWIAPLGPNVDSFEQEMASYTGSGGAVALSSGTAAIHLALKLLGIKRNDYVFCSSLTFVASANPIVYEGANPIFIDSEPETWNMSPEALKSAFNDAETNNQLPKAVIVVNLYGQSARMDEISTICEHYNVPIIEDAAESLGSSYKGKKSGTFGHFGIYSFNGNKIISTSGGGMLVSDHIDLLEKARFLATQARDAAPYYEHSQTGYNYRLSNLLAGVGRAQLEVLEDRVQTRREIFLRYEDALCNLPGIELMPELTSTRSNRWLTAMTIDKQKFGLGAGELIGLLEKENIEARHVWKPLHMQPLFKHAAFYSHHVEEVVSEDLFNRGICLPSGSAMTIDEQMFIIDCIVSAAVSGKAAG
ncbi:aminotransferase class I/II-fold pyridoxal phosphate-dependent enzyme [Metabacillus indicus]|uniref:Pyridoxal phosphate-dependent aminotransferase n=1 Tax=Metabacillus indicus TaxID=246786 RepID=A0A084H4G7_METID|nr:aminotransferase class I/II-fold pyridoxal phosphate-dependent enzyme [Metabacillus indicus]KEZ50323.1 pyridoxal phosphate-dependent aminotransferase [Metabacillus indicus LMG 22858]KEZ54479.1 pyridoxal phosphate-dependent aminotransferase [Metabacillus indicus]